MNEQKVPSIELTGKAHQNAEKANIPAPMVERAFRVLDLVGAADEGLTLSDLARSLKMSKGSMHGLLKTLEQAGVLEQDEQRAYLLGPRLYDLARQYAGHAGLRRLALPVMHRLAEEVGETVFLGRVETRGVRILETALPEYEQAGLCISARRGTRVHLLAGATGRVVLARWSPAELTSFLHEHTLPRFTEHSITDPAILLKALEETRNRGVGIDRGEYLAGVNAVAAPLYGPPRDLVALLWIVGFASRFDEPALERAAALLHTEAVALSRALGGSL